MTRQEQAPASPPWQATKCLCGHPACRQYILSGQGTVGFEADDARLLCGAANSYAKACGPRAVECAEADLLGEALRALCETAAQCEAWIKDAGGCDHSVGICMCEEIAQVARAGAVLAKASGERT